MLISASENIRRMRKYEKRIYAFADGVKDFLLHQRASALAVYATSRERTSSNLTVRTAQVPAYRQASFSNTHVSVQSVRSYNSFW